jgi:hypothetical protein
MFRVEDIFERDENVVAVQQAMNEAVAKFVSKHGKKMFHFPKDWTDDQVSTMLVFGYFGAFSFREWGLPKVDDFFDKERHQLESKDDLLEMFFELEQLYNSLEDDRDECFAELDEQYPFLKEDSDSEK